MSIYIAIAPIISYANLAIVAVEAVLTAATSARALSLVTNTTRMISKSIKYKLSKPSLATHTIGVGASVGIISATDLPEVINNFTGVKQAPTVTLDLNKNNIFPAPAGWNPIYEGSLITGYSPPQLLDISSLVSDVQNWPSGFNNWNDAEFYGVPNSPETVTYKYISGNVVQYRTLKIKPSISTSFSGVDSEGFQFLYRLTTRTVDNLNRLVVGRYSSTSPEPAMPQGYILDTTQTGVAKLVNPSIVKKPVDFNCNIGSDPQKGLVYDDADPDCDVFRTLSHTFLPFKLQNGIFSIGTDTGQMSVQQLEDKTVITDYRRSPADVSKMQQTVTTLNPASDGTPVVESQVVNTYDFPAVRPLPGVEYGLGGDYAETNSTTGTTTGTASNSAVNFDSSKLTQETTLQRLVDASLIISDLLDTTSADQQLESQYNTQAEDQSTLNNVTDSISRMQELNRDNTTFTLIKEKILSAFPQKTTNDCTTARIPVPNIFSTISGITSHPRNSGFDLDVSYYTCFLQPYVNYLGWMLVSIAAYREINNIFGGAAPVAMDEATGRSSRKKSIT